MISLNPIITAVSRHFVAISCTASLSLVFSTNIFATESDLSGSHIFDDITVTEWPWEDEFLRWGITKTPKPFRNPKLPPNLVELPGADEDTMKVPEGLTLVGDGKLDLKRRTIIFVHGWALEGEAESFHMPELWNEQGFNTFIYYWHRDAYDRSLIPTVAQEKIWKRVGENLYQDYINKLGPALGSLYKEEIRVVGHSLGTQMGTYLVYKLHRAKFPHMVQRFDMIDPVVGENFLSNSSPVRKLLPEFNRGNPKTITIKQAMRYMLTSLTTYAPKVPTIAYLSLATILTQAIQYDRIWEARPVKVGSWSQEIYSMLGVYDAVHVQAMKRSWLFDLFETFTGNRGNFFSQLVYFFTLQHILIKDVYMESIDPLVDPPLLRLKSGKVIPAFDAKYKTEDLKKIRFKKFYSQILGNQTVEMEDDLFKPIRISPACNERTAGRLEFRFCF